jgi:hypothetical protein
MKMLLKLHKFVYRVLPRYELEVIFMFDAHSDGGSEVALYLISEPHDDHTLTRVMTRQPKKEKKENTKKRCKAK